MQDQIQSIRDFINYVPHKASCALNYHADNFCDCGRQEALTALDQLEAMVGEPVAELRADMKGGGFVHWLSDDVFDIGTKLYAVATVAQQPQAETDDSIAADAYGMACDEMERWQHERLKAGKDAGTTGSLVDGIAWLYGYIDDLEAKQPQAEAVPSDCDVRKIMLAVVPGPDGMGHEVYAKSVDDVVNLLTKMGERIENLEWAKHQVNEREHNVLMRAMVCSGKKVEAPQQAEAVPPGYVLVPVKPSREIEYAIGRARNLKASEIWECAIDAARWEGFQAAKQLKAWQPIETAPTELEAQYLVYTPGTRYKYDVCRNMNGFRIIGNTFDFDRAEQPTMWMPITPAEGL